MSSLSDLYNSIKAAEAKFPLPQTEQTFPIGTLDLTSIRTNIWNLGVKWDDEIVFSYAIPTYQGPGYAVPIEIVDGPDTRIEYYKVPGKGGVLSVANIEILNITILITNWNEIGSSGNIQISLGIQSQTVTYGTTEVTFNNVTETNPAFSIIVTNSFGANPVKALLPLQIVWNLIAAGAITIPTIPVALVYAPVVDGQKKNFASTSQQISAGNTTTISFTKQNSTTKPVPTSFQGSMDVQKTLGAIGSTLSKIPNPYTMAIGAGLSLIASGLGSSTATQTDLISINHQNSLTIANTSSQSITAYSSDGGPGVGDIILYLYNVKVAWYSNNGVMTLAILGYEGSNQTTMYKLTQALTTLQTQPEGTKDSSLHLDIPSIMALQKLDPFVAGGPKAVLDTNRFVDVSGGVQGVGGGGYTQSHTYSVTSTNIDTSTNTTVTIENDSPGFLSIFGLGVTENQTLQTQISQSSVLQTSSTQTLSQSFSLFGSSTEQYNCWVYFDNVFLAFAFRDMDV